MSSQPLPTAIFTPSSEAALVAAVCDVAERSFFAFAEPCDAGRFAELVDGTDRWYSAAVEFHEGECSGTVRCLVPDDAALTMFDAFSGRGIDEPAPPPAEVCDLMGEMANMVCGSWLTRAASHQTFSLRTMPVIVSPACAPIDGENWITIAVNDRPFAVAVRIEPSASLAGTSEM
jgi:Chemotaxis phosphatase CheX